MEHGERSALEAISKILDMVSGTTKGVVSLGVKGGILLAKMKSDVVAGNNNISKLRKSGEPLNVVKINEIDKNYIMKSSKDMGVPVSVVKNKDEHFMFFKESDSKLVQMIIEKQLEKTLKDKGKDKNINVPNNDMKKDKIKDVEVRALTGENRLALLDKNNSTVVKDTKYLLALTNGVESIIVGKDNFLELNKYKNELSIVKINKKDILTLENASKEFKIPIVVSKNKDNYFMFLKKIDYKKLELILEKKQDRTLPKDDNKLEKKQDVKEKNNSNIKNKDVEKEISDKNININPDNNIRNKVKEAQKRLNTPSVEKTLDIVKEKTISKAIER